MQNGKNNMVKNPKAYPAINWAAECAFNSSRAHVTQPEDKDNTIIRNNGIL